MTFLKALGIMTLVIFAIVLWPLWIAVFELWPLWLLLAIPVLAVYGLVKLVSGK